MAALSLGFDLAIGMTTTQAADEPDLPPIGRSAFDHVVGTGPVPFPFERLLARLDAGLVGDGLPPVKSVLIPLGRSLQRSAGAPEFFKYPRVVAAVDRDNKLGAPPLKDRLFLGYHEKGEVVEVISYNAQAGRFEFQVVRDYRPGGRPRVFYARRGLCLACHQNAAPIFARPLWDETPANPEIAARLRAAHRDFYGVPLTGTDIAYFVDAASDRANLFSVWQTLWQRGCGQDEAGERCRMQALTNALRYALSGVLPPPDVLDTELKQLEDTWRRNWPEGLAIPNPDIPNRDPLAALPGVVQGSPVHTPPQAGEGGAGTAVELTTLAHVPASFEPLQVRPPLEIWRQPDIPRFIGGLTGLLDGAQVRQLDGLLTKGRHAGVRVALDCTLVAKEGSKRLRLRCDGRGKPALEGHLEIQGQQVSGRLERLRLAAAVAAPDLDLQGIRQRQGYRLTLRRGQQPARLSDGRLLEALVLDEGKVELVIRDDFAAVIAAIEKQREQGTFVSRTFTDALLSGLTSDLGASSQSRVAPLPPAQVEAVAQSPSTGVVGPFRRHCGACHDTALIHPPNFLRGSDDAVQARLAHCAERIYYRLGMWSVPEAQRSKTPMPPLPVLASQGYDPESWAASPELAALRAHAEQLLRAAGRSPAEVFQQPFESLRSCLPAAAGYAERHP